MAGVDAPRPHRIRRAVPRLRRRTSPTVTPRAGPPPPDLVDGREDHDRLGDAREQGPGGHRGALAVRCRLRRDRGRDPPAERRPLRRPVRRRLPEGPAGHPGHATPDPVRPDLSRPPPVAGRRGSISSPPAASTSARPTRRASRRCRIAREAGRIGPAGHDRAHRRRRGRRRPVPRRHASTSRASRACSRPPSSASATAGDQAPDLDELIALDAEVRAAFATGPIGSRLMDGSAPARSSRSSCSSSILGGLVLVHEFGHFVTARLAGVRVLEFGDRLPAAGQGPPVARARRSTRSTGCRSAASSSSKARTATRPTTRARSSAQPLPDHA